MRLTARFKRLTVWNKFAFIGSVASLVSIPLSIAFFVLSHNTSIPIPGGHNPVEAPRLDGIGTLNARQATFKAAISFVAERRNLTSEDIAFLNRLLQDVTYEDVEHLVQGSPQQSSRKSIESAIASHELVSTERVSGLSWGGMPVSIRFLESTDPTLDFSNVDLFSEGGGFEEVAKNLALGLSSSAAVQVCTTDLASLRRLELIIIRQPKA